MPVQEKDNKEKNEGRKAKWHKSLKGHGEQRVSLSRSGRGENQRNKGGKINLSAIIVCKKPPISLFRSTAASEMYLCFLERC